MTLCLAQKMQMKTTQKFNWFDLELAGHLVLLEMNEVSRNMIKQALAVITLMKAL